VHFGHFYDRVPEIADLANRSSVAIYSIDSRGLSATNSSFFWSQGVANALASDTGGLFFKDYNDLGKLLSEAVQDYGGGYYLLGWYPGAGAFALNYVESKYHKLTVRVLRKGLTVRSRAGFMGTPVRPSPPVPNTPNARMRDAIWSPFRSGDLNVELTTRWGRDGQDDPYVEGLVHVAPEGIEFREEPGGCRSVNLVFLFAAVPLDTPFTSTWQPPESKLSSYVSAMTLCGEAARRVAQDGLVWRGREKTPKPGLYDVRVAVRNALAVDLKRIPGRTESVAVELLSAPPRVGSASQVIEIPKLSSNKLAVAGLTLSGDYLKEADDGRVKGIAVRPASASDPGVRRFRAGEEVRYNWRVLYAAKPGQGHPVDARIVVQRDGEDIYQGAPSELSFTDGQASVAGVYRTESLPPGRYWLGATTADKTAKGQPSGVVTEWLHFDIEQ
jgi:hypothetical protein